jgi:hypothetical protein
LVLLAFSIGCSQEPTEQPNATPDPGKQLADTQPGKKVEKPAKATPPTLQFDGVYQSKQIDDSWQYLRFYADGTVIAATSTGEPTAVAGWVNKQNIKSKNLPNGRYEITDDKLSFFPSPNADRLTMKVRSWRTP